MNLRHLKSFLCIAELGSLSKASDRMRIAQPALSRQMQLLQSEVGTRLFHRHRAGMRLTEAGERLRGRLAAVLRQLELAYEEARSVESEPTGPVVFGVVPTVSALLASRLALAVARRLPRVSLRIVESYSGHVVDWLTNGRVDAAIVYGPAANVHFQATDLLSEELMLVGPPGSGLSVDSALPVSALSNRSLILPSRSHGLRTVVENAAARARVTLEVACEADSFRVMKELVEKGLGFTTLPYSTVAQEVAEGRLTHAPLIKPVITRSLVLGVHQPGGSAAAKAVVELAFSEVRTMVTTGEWRARLRPPVRRNA